MGAVGAVGAVVAMTVMRILLFMLHVNMMRECEGARVTAMVMVSAWQGMRMWVAHVVEVLCLV